MINVRWFINSILSIGYYDWIFPRQLYDKMNKLEGTLEDWRDLYRLLINRKVPKTIDRIKNDLKDWSLGKEVKVHSDDVLETQYVGKKELRRMGLRGLQWVLQWSETT